jgi:hypothetical protein
MTQVVWIVSPVYRDVASFSVLRLKILEHLHPPCDWQIHFVVTDDTAGTDPEMAALRELPDVEVVEPPFNLGHQRGLVYALRIIRARVGDQDLIVTLDADGEDRPEDVPRLLAPLIAHPEDRYRISLARRTARQESRAFRAFYGVFKIAFRALTGTTINTGNFAAYWGAWGRRRLIHPNFNLAYSGSSQSRV